MSIGATMENRRNGDWKKNLEQEYVNNFDMIRRFIDAKNG